jgi:environmental stress-induced protein Ves
VRGPIHLPAAVRKAQPWKNGGGRTTTIIEEPHGASLEGLDWRISVADIDTSGPFSIFPGMTRHLLVLTGRVRLSGQHIEAELGMDNGPITFPGDTSITATPVATPVRVLNVMVRTDQFGGTVQRCSSSESRPANHLTIFVALRPLVITVEGESYPLAFEDGLIFIGPTTVRCGPDLVSVDIFDVSQDCQ